MTPRLLVLGLLLLPSPPPDSWLPFRDKRVVAEHGDQYVVIRKSGHDAITFELCRRHAGAPRMQPATSGGRKAKDQDAIARDPKDVLDAEGKVSQLPLDVVVLDDLPGFVLFEKYYNVGGGQAVIYVDAVSLTVRDLVEKDESSGYRATAAAALHRIGSRDSVDALLEAARTAEERTADVAMEAAIEIGAPDLGKRLIRILESGWTTQDARIARYFLARPSKTALPALERALARWPEGTQAHRHLRSALAVCPPRFLAAKLVH